MLTEYLEAAMRRANYEILPDDNAFYGEISGFDGVYANSDNLETCRSELRGPRRMDSAQHISPFVSASY